MNYEEKGQKLKKRIKMKNKLIKPIGFIFFCIELTGCKTNSVKDIDGNVYKAVTIGTQVWMAGNLKTTKYNDGTAIPLVKEDKTWETLNTPAYCWYKNDAVINKNIYGALYNWYTVNTNKLCPSVGMYLQMLNGQHGRSI
jgi:Fibrobacter succinogenes major domain (Fib_succ_major)